MAPPRRVPGTKRRRVDNSAGSRSFPVPQARMSEVSFDAYSNQLNDEDLIDQATISSGSETPYRGNARWPTQSKKRKRGVDHPQQPPPISQEDQEHMMWSDALLDFFVLQRGDDLNAQAPPVPAGVNINRALDDKGHTALHWAAAMGNLDLVREFIRLGANVNSLTNTGATPLIHAISFTNNSDKKTMPYLVEELYSTVGQRDCFQSTVFHHIAQSTASRSRYSVARYYFLEILQRLYREYGMHGISDLINQQDDRGDTALLTLAKNGARKCVRLLAEWGARMDIANHSNETAETFILKLNERRRDRQRHLSSSPVPPNDAFQADPATKSNGYPPSQARASQYTSEAATLLSSQLPVLINARVEALAAAYETELAGRETEVQESERLLELRRQELSTMRKQVMSLSAQDQDDVVISMEEDDVQHIADDSRRLLEEEQSLELRSILARYMKAQGPKSMEEPQTEQTAIPTLSGKLHVARKISNQQERRKDLLNDILLAQGLASRRDERHDIYKQLIMSALGVKADDVETMLPEILQELEEGRFEVPERAGGSVALDVAMGNAGTAPVRMAMPVATASVQNGNLVYAPVQVAG